MAVCGRVSAGSMFKHILRFRAELDELNLLRKSGSTGCSPVTPIVGNCRAYASAAATGVLRGLLLAKCKL